MVKDWARSSSRTLLAASPPPGAAGEGRPSSVSSMRSAIMRSASTSLSVKRTSSGATSAKPIALQNHLASPRLVPARSAISRMLRVGTPPRSSRS